MPVYRITGCVTRTCDFTVEVEADNEDIASEIAQGEAWECRTATEFDILDVEIYDATEVEGDQVDDRPLRVRGGAA